jgi:uncharacterized Zn-finger protein
MTIENFQKCFKVDNSIIYKTYIKSYDRFECTLCEYKCTTKGNLKRHIKMVHDKIKDFECSLCDYKFSTKGNLKTHIKQVHDKIKDVQCSLCEYKFSTKGNLKTHIKQVHDKIKDFECTLCEYKCSEKNTLKKHIKQVHDKIKNFECTLCKFKCSLNSNLKRHIKIVHDKIKDFECTLCEYKCSQKSTLKRHIEICTGDLNISSLEFNVKNSLINLGFIENDDYIFNSSYFKLTDFCGRPLRPDFRFLYFKCIIEADGKQHSKPINFGGISNEEAEINFKYTQKCDTIKNKFCEKFGYKMIRIKHDEKNILGFLHSELIEFMDN